VNTNQKKIRKRQMLAKREKTIDFDGLMMAMKYVDVMVDPSGQGSAGEEAR